MSEAEPLITINISNYNYARFLPQAIESALSQTYANKEIIVVDDGSTDDSAAVIRRYADRVIPVFKKNGGECTSVNAGFERSRGDMVCFLDADDALLPHALEKVAALARETPDVVKVHWPLIAIDVNGAELGRTNPSEPLSEGDLREAVIARGPDAYPSPPTSGNAWSRRYLEKRMPIPAAEFPIAGDAYLELLAPFFGTIRKLDEPAGLYRVHGRNSSGQVPFAQKADLFDYRCHLLSEHLRARGIAHDPERWKGADYQRWRQFAELGRTLEPFIPAGARYILVDDNQWAQCALIPRREALPFLEKDNIYWGVPPDSGTAVRELERMRETPGARFVVFGQPAFWWLDYFSGLREHLEKNYRCTLRNDTFVVFDLRAAA
jgi:glycosyltransferase involved in cell wall biosynthesis